MQNLKLLLLMLILKGKNEALARSWKSHLRIEKFFTSFIIKLLQKNSSLLILLQECMKLKFSYRRVL
ncbi:unnamed protein product [Rhizophagus irregularis]|nr:unnamed protein product [Rhizophagus irregularis]